MSGLAQPVPAPRAPFAGLPALQAPDGRYETAAPWLAGIAAALLLHGLMGLPVFAPAEPDAAPAAPEAAVMIDLPPELALPPLESVESSAAPRVEAGLAEVTSADPPAERAPAEPTPPSIPQRDLQPVETVPRSQPVPSDLPDEASEASPPAVAAAAVEPAAAQPADPVETPPSEIAEPTGSIEGASVISPPAAVVEPAPAVRPTDKPRPVVTVAKTEKPRPVEKAAKPERKAAAQDPPKRSAGDRSNAAKRIAEPAPSVRAAKPAAGSQGAMDSPRGAGAGKPDADVVARYVASVRADIMRERRGARARGRGRVAVVRFTIQPSGALSGVVLAATSGDPALDEAAVGMVRRASPVPPMPAGMAKNLPTRLPVRFD